MENYKVVENSLVPVYENGKGIKIVDARELHSFLEVGKDFSTWIKDRIAKYGFIEHADYATLPKNGEPDNKGFQGRKDYVLILDMAKEIAMVENNERGRQARRYFIDVEKKYQQIKQSIQVPNDSYMIEDPIKRAERWIQEEKERFRLQQKVEEDSPKVEAFDKFISADTLQDMATVAKVLGWGRNNLFKELRFREILRYNNTPYQTYIDRGYFEVKERSYYAYGQTNNTPQTYVTAKGVEWLSKILK